MNKRMTIGLDLGGTNIEAVVLTRDNKTVAQRTVATDADRGPQHVIRRLAGLVDNLIAGSTGGERGFGAIGVGAPGPLSHERGIVLHAPNLPGWTDIPLRDALQEATKMPVALENDANAAAFGEFVLGAGESVNDMVMLTIGTGIGGGIIVDGALLRGRFDHAGEIGHVIVELDGRPCQCGQRGCLERYASARAIGELAAEAVEAGDAGMLSERAEGGRTIDARDVEHAAHLGDPVAARIWDEACRYLAIACVMIQHTINPECVVLAGGLSGAGERLIEPVREHFRRLTWKSARDGPRIVCGTLGTQAGALGAAALAREIE